MIKTIMVGSVSITRPAEAFVAKPMHVPTLDKLIVLRDRYIMYCEFADCLSRSSGKHTLVINNALVGAAHAKKQLNKMYLRWRMGVNNETVE